MPGFINDNKKGFTRLAAASDEVYQMLVHGRWFSPGTAASSTIKTAYQDIAESGVKHNKSNQSFILPLYNSEASHDPVSPNWLGLWCLKSYGSWFYQSLSPLKLLVGIL